MEIGFLLKGLILGFSIAAPVGPIGILCIRRTLSDGRLIGFFSGLGAATADMFYGSIAAFGLTAIQTLLIGGQFWLKLVGGLFLLYLGLRTFFSRPAENATKTNNQVKGFAGAYLSTVLLTLTNPATIISFTVIFAGLGFANTNGNYLAPVFLVLGVFLGSSIWWLTLSTIVGLLRKKFTLTWMVWVNRLAGSIIFGFGVVALLLK